MALIGVFDSGVGGLSILDEALRQLPNHDYLYFADSANAPYGERSAEWIAERSLSICQSLADEGCQAIVVACNTATAEAIQSIRAQLKTIPIIGVEPGIKPAALQSEKGLVGVLATEATLKSDKFNALLATLPVDCRFVKQAGAGLVPLIESGQLHAPETAALLAQHLQPMRAAGIDTLVLGCTHYPFLMPLILNQLGSSVRVVDTSEAVIRQLARQLEAHRIPTEVSGRRSLLLLSTADGTRLHSMAMQLLNSNTAELRIDFKTVGLDQTALCR
ncbi:glutamate racemase [Polynucleobacter sp.]|uniref:glutamate racemase n=1 Tax=Polynucleobacter sp. TaxID=2029855 RepID=UPI002737556A|nr:glutamate racemase [Polynucleobacter sp.]MDP3121402.1 glutamate racemase [Polynucleobacter sp.]